MADDISSFLGISPPSPERQEPPPITVTTHCHIFNSGQQQGPYVPQQIKAMWNAGVLTADTLVFPDGFPDWIPISDFLARIHLRQTHADSLSFGVRSAGILVTIFGVIITIYFAALYDTSVTTESRYISGIGTIGGHSVVNLGKQQNRLIGVIVGVAISAIGIVMMKHRENR